MSEKVPHTPIEQERQRVIALCYEKARAYLDSHRVQVDTAFVGKKKYPHSGSDTVYAKAEIDNDISEVERLNAVFQFNNSRASDAERKRYEDDKKLSDIFEAMFADIAQTVFNGGVEVIVPSQFDDYKRQTDLIIVFKDATGKPEASMVIDFTTAQDVEGYTTEDGHKGGLEHKWAQSLRGIASKRQHLHSIKYAAVDGKIQEIQGAPRVLVGLSVQEILRLAPQWNAGTLDMLADARVRELSTSIQKQLVVQLHLAKKYKQNRAYQHILSTIQIAKARAKYIDDSVARPREKDTVLERIHGLHGVAVRDEYYSKARAAQKEFEKQTQRAEWRKHLEEPLSAAELEHLEKHLAKVDATGELKKQIALFIEGKPHTLHKGILLSLAGGVPTRLWRRLQVLKTIEPPQKTHEKNEHTDTHSAAHTEAHTTTENTHEIHLDASTHLALLKKASGVTEEKYNQLDTRGKRIWSFIKEKGIRGLVAGIGSALGSTLALALCAPAFPSMLVAVGGALAGSLLAQHLMKKYYYSKHPDKDHTKDRARVATIQNLARWAKENPYSFAQLYGGPQGDEALKKAIERKVFMRNLAGNALAVGIGTIAGLEVRTGGQFTKTALSGDYDALWKLFYCDPASHRRNGVPIDGQQRTDGIPVGQRRSAPVQIFETPRPRLSALTHQQCIGQCTSTAPWGYHSWVPGRIGSSGQQLYQLRYTPR